MTQFFSRWVRIPQEFYFFACSRCVHTALGFIPHLKSLEQFADNVNSHPTSLGHGDPYQDPKYQTGRGKIPRSH